MPGSPSSSHGFDFATVTLTDAQVKALPVTPVTLVATPGSGLILCPVLFVVSKTLAGAYTNVDSSATLNVAYGGTVSSGLTCLALANSDTSIYTSASANKHWIAPLGANFSGFQQLAPPDNGDPRNLALSIAATNAAAGAFTGGNAANVVTVAVMYAVVAVPV